MTLRRVVVATGLVIASCFALLAPAGSAGAAWTPVRGLDIPKHRLFDLGVVDVDRDGRLDVFSVNHKFRGVLLRNRGRFRLADRLPRLGLGHAPQFPGFDSLRPPSDMSKPGAYAWLTDRAGEPGRIHLAAVGKEVRVKVEVLAAARVVRKRKAEVKPRRPDDRIRRFTTKIKPGGKVLLNATALGELPISFDFNASEEIGIRQIRVGERGARPETRQFEVQLHDRHGFAFTDLNADGAADVFMLGGGAGGRIEKEEFNEMISDELMVSNVGPGAVSYNELIDGSGLEKSNCRGRDAAWVDYDSDGRVDLFFTCENRAPILARGLGDERFEAVSSPPVEARIFRWVRLKKGDPRLVAAARGGLEIWRIRNGRWRLEQRIRRGRATTQISAADMDNDGRIDLVTVSNRRVRIFRNAGGKLRKTSESKLGLPDGERAVTPVDIDNDGWTDLSTGRNGTLRWDPAEKRFEKTGWFKRRTSDYAILNWPDLDNDGRRDLLAAYSEREFSSRSIVDVRRNRSRSGRWLQVDLIGSRGNRDAIGARVVVQPLGRRGVAPRRITQYVGQNEGSRHSQGHYRTYFGLDRAKRARVTVVWPDGDKTKKRRVRSNRRLVLRK